MQYSNQRRSKPRKNNKILRDNSAAECQTHNLEVGGANPSPATKYPNEINDLRKLLILLGFFLLPFWLFYCTMFSMMNAENS